MDSQIFIVEPHETKQRVDIYLSNELECSRSQAANIVKNGLATVNNSVVKAGHIVREGDTIVFTAANLSSAIVPQNIMLDVLYQDDHIAVINKPQALAVHPGGGVITGTLANALLYHYKALSNLSGVERPGIVHRLDKDTSGVMVIAKTNNAHLNLSTQFASRTITKKYIAIVEGNPKNDSDEVKTFITRDYKNRKLMKVSTFEGKEAITRYTVLEKFTQNALVEFNILTGRTHQIRVHAKHLGNPVVGDKSYGRLKQKFNLMGQLLHAKTLDFNHPISNKRLSFTAEPNSEFNRILNLLRSNNLGE